MGFFDRLARFVGPEDSTPIAPARDAAPPGFVDDPRQMDIIDPAAGFGGANSLFNAMSGAGSLRDASIFAKWVPQRRLTKWELFALGRNALTARGLGLVGNTATREGWRVLVDDPRVSDPQACTVRISQYEQRLGLSGKVARAAFRSRQYSQAIVLMNIIDGRAWDEPVDVNNITSIRWTAVVDRRDFYVSQLADIDSGKFATPSMYRITDINGVLEDGLRFGDGLGTMYTILDAGLKQSKGHAGFMDVHADRVLSFATTDFYPLMEGMQDSVSAYFETTRGMQQAAREASMRIYKIKDLFKKVFGIDSGKVYQRLRFVEALKSSLGAWVIDEQAEDVAAMPNTASAGLASMADPFMTWVAAGFNTPITVFWGASPSGFNTGDAERATWHEEVRAWQDQILANVHALPKIHGYMLAAADGCRLTADVRRTIEFNDLSPPDEETRSELRSTALQDLSRINDDGAITRKEYRKTLSKISDDLFPIEITDEGESVAADAPVGVFTGSLEIARAAALREIPVGTGKALLLTLAPSSFNAERVATVFDPIEASLAAANPTPTLAAPPVAGVSAAPSALVPAAVPVDEEDAELTSLFSQLAVPADAKTADLVAAAIGEGVTADQIKRRAKAGDFPIYPPEGFGSRPRFSIAEAKRALLVRHGVLPSGTQKSPVVDAADLDFDTVCAWLREHYSMAPKLTRPRIAKLMTAREMFPFLRAPECEYVYRGLANIKPSLVGKLLSETDPTRDKSWTTDFDQAVAFAKGKYIAHGEIDPEAIGVVLVAKADSARLLLNAKEIAALPEVASYVNPIWNMPLRQAILDEREVIADGPLVVVEVRAVLMSETTNTLTQDEADALVQNHWALAFDYESGGPLLRVVDETDRAILRSVYALNEAALMRRAADKHSEHSACIVVELPRELAWFVPAKVEDPSPAHVTVVYVSETQGRDTDLMATVMSVVLDFAPFDVEATGDVDYFDRAQQVGGGQIAYCPIESDVLGLLNERLVEALTASGFNPSVHPQGYTPHATLAYLPADVDAYTGPSPRGTWTASGLVVYFGDNRHMDIALGGSTPEIDA
jgi:2'-5' RNA ligase